MAGSLIKIDEEIVSSDVATVEIGGSNWDTSFDVYVVQMIGVTGTADSNFEMRVLKDVSGTPTAQTTANYDRAYKVLYSAGAFTNSYNTNQTSNLVNGGYAVGTDTNESYNATQYLFNFNNSSEYSFFTQETSFRNSAGALAGNQGGGVYTVGEAHIGCQYYFTSGNIEAGSQFILYGLKK